MSYQSSRIAYSRIVLDIYIYIILLFKPITETIRLSLLAYSHRIVAYSFDDGDYTRLYGTIQRLYGAV